MRVNNLFLSAVIMCTTLMLNAACKSTNTSGTSDDESATHVAAAPAVSVPEFSEDSAFIYLKKQVDFGPRVPNSNAHKLTGDWLAEQLKRHGAEVHEQHADLRAFDGSVLKARNIFGRFNPQIQDNRLLLLAHYDTRPWADQDIDPAKHSSPIDGANDGASGVAVILEAARAIAGLNPGYGIDILFCDAEDYGTDNNEESWAMGARYFADNMQSNGWTPARAILLDMVGGKNAKFPYEYFSHQAAPQLDRRFRAAASAAGFAAYFPDSMGGAVTDDHLELLKHGVPAIDIIEYNSHSGFNPTWHTSQDNLANISKETLKAVGQSLLQYIYTNVGS